jgi:Na+/serine symporter
MTTPAQRRARDVASVRAGTIAVVLGLVFLAATAYTYALSLGEAFNPPQWARVLGLMWLPVGLVGTPVAYSLARSGAGRDRGRAGLLLVLVGVVAFVALVVAVG